MYRFYTCAQRFVPNAWLTRFYRSLAHTLLLSSGSFHSLGSLHNVLTTRSARVGAHHALLVYERRCGGSTGRGSTRYTPTARSLGGKIPLRRSQWQVVDCIRGVRVLGQRGGGGGYLVEPVILNPQRYAGGLDANDTPHMLGRRYRLGGWASVAGNILSSCKPIYVSLSLLS